MTPNEGTVEIMELLAFSPSENEGVEAIIQQCVDDQNAILMAENKLMLDWVDANCTGAEFAHLMRCLTPKIVFKFDEFGIRAVDGGMIPISPRNHCS